MYTLRCTSLPATTPLTTAEAKAHLRVTHSDDDGYIDSLVEAATYMAELITGRRFVTQTWKMCMDNWPCEGKIEIPYSPVTSLTAGVKYYDENGTLQTFDSSLYVSDLTAEPARIVLAPAQGSWPGLQSGAINRIEVSFVAGYGAAAAVPKAIKQAILILVAHMYESREPIITGTILQSVPNSFKWLLSPYEVFYSV